ncbi:MAG TPA: NADH-quinone oxidoreductase subunit N [Flavisolibacter sp.]|nr:NADH-quinone oxidoreductase subunit N [Flavisolibacter sp.]
MESVLLLKNELWIAVLIFLLLFIKIGKGMKNDSLLTLVQVLLLVNVVLGFLFNKDGSAFSGMFYSNAVIAFQKNILSIATFLISLLCADWLKKTPHLSEFFVLLLSAQLGMFFMISSGNLLMFYLGLELSTIPVAALGNFDLEKRISSEAAMKMILSSAFSTGILLFGISLVYGATGTISFAELPQALSSTPLQILAFVFLVSAFGFKLSVVPFHLWTADVYEGSPIAVTSFLSVVSKGSIAFIFLTALYKVFQPLNGVWYNMIVILALATMIIGNLFALRQQNIKRFLAFSSIAQVGFILVGMSSNAGVGLTSITYFVLIYVFSNLAAFGVASVISEKTGKENIDDYKGLYQTNPFLSWILALALFSLAGIPPTAGFFGKLFLITAGATKGNYWFITMVALNLIVSLYYYLRVVRAVFMDKNEQPIERIKGNRAVNFGLTICAAGIVLVGLVSWIYEYISKLS